MITFRPTQGTQREQGFTLIELLVVIIIIGILAAIAIPIFMNQRKKAVDGSVRADLRTVAEQMETYYVTDLTYPIALDGIQQTVNFPLGSETAVLSPGVNAKIVIGTAGSVGHYAICGWNINGKANAETNAWVWNSAQGGQQPTPSACPAGDSLI